ncbi:RBR-type E3 ubiquitin transferase [Paragonimus heterotremus]|uniref:RBR-type E3 ubiquitin transferase n=1 Tax=Paragonimus heterotremus TaxID=100268 RepID=A0A8J4TBS2_9TREM|nr:RBR-type E3 ubiquitin transferase [Paragonimus heterotremus]
MGNTQNSHSSPPPSPRPSFLRGLMRRMHSGNRAVGPSRATSGLLLPVTEHDGECPVCFQPAEVLVQFSPCSHKACTVCWLTFMCTEIDNFAMARLTCIGCKEPLDSSTVVNMLTGAILSPDSYGTGAYSAEQVSSLVDSCIRMLARYEEFLLRRALAKDPDTRWCPYGCGYGLIARGFKPCPQLVCERPECHGQSFCYNCQRPWSTDEESGMHRCSPAGANRNDVLGGVYAFLGITQIRRRLSTPIESTQTPSSRRPSFQRLSSQPPAELTPMNETESLPFASGSVSEEPSSEVSQTRVEKDSSVHSSSGSIRELSENVVDETKPCPTCGSLIQKVDDGSCNHITCSICGADFCWLCLKPLSVGHYLSFSGCTVWGRRRWSPARRALVILGLMFGTPILLPIGMALAIPTATIGLTTLLCSKIGRLYQNRKVTRGFVVFGTCLVGLLVTSVLSVVTVTILSLLFLGYVYIFLPTSALVSACRLVGRRGS